MPIGCIINDKPNDYIEREKFAALTVHAVVPYAHVRQNHSGSASVTAYYGRLSVRNVSIVAHRFLQK